MDTSWRPGSWRSCLSKRIREDASGRLSRAELARTLLKESGYTLDQASVLAALRDDRVARAAVIVLGRMPATATTVKALRGALDDEFLLGDATGSLGAS